MKRKNRLPLNEKIALWVYGNDPQLINSPTRRDQSRLTIEAVIGVCGLTLIQGNFLQGLLIYLGATDGVLSLVSVLGLIAGAAAIFGGYIFQGREKRKNIIVAMILTGRLASAMVVFVPLLFPKGSPFTIPIMVAIVAFCYVMTSLADTGYNSMLVGLMPIDARGRLTGVRSAVTQSIVPIISFVAALYLDRFRDNYWGFVVVYTIGGLLIICEAIMISRVNEPAYPKSDRFGFSKLPSLLKNNMPFCIFAAELFVMYVFRHLSVSFNSAYLMKYNGFSYTLMTVATTFSTIVSVLLYKKIGRINDRVGSGRVLFVAIALFAAEALTLAIIPTSLIKYLFFIPYGLTAVAGATMTVSSFARKFELIPEADLTVFVGILGVATGSASALGSFLGNQLKLFIENNASEAILMNLWQFRFVYLAGAVTLSGLLVFLFVKNKGAKV